MKWLCPYDGTELGGRAVLGDFKRWCHHCGKQWTTAGNPFDGDGNHNKRAVKV